MSPCPNWPSLSAEEGKGRKSLRRSKARLGSVFRWSRGSEGVTEHVCAWIRHTRVPLREHVEPGTKVWMPSGPVEKEWGDRRCAPHSCGAEKSMRRRRSQLGATGDPRGAGLACADSCVRRPLPALDASCSRGSDRSGAQRPAGPNSRARGT